jgi:signal peptidase I
MMPTVHDGDRLLYNPFFKNVERGDVVVISHGGDMLIKRVIAIGGDHLTISTYGSVAINGKWQNETYINPQEQSGESIDITIPDNELWVMGDNRGHSLDSRNFGTVKMGDVAGVVIIRKNGGNDGK